MDNYSKVLTFFMENNIVLNKEQLEALKEEFLDEGALKKLVDRRMDKVNNLYDKANNLSAIKTDNRQKEASELRDQARKIENNVPYNRKDKDIDVDFEWRGGDSRHVLRRGNGVEQLKNTDEINDAYITSATNRKINRNIDEVRNDNKKSFKGKLDNALSKRKDMKEKDMNNKVIKQAEDEIRMQKYALGQGKDHMPKDREPGTYLKKQEQINKYEKGEK